MHHDVVLAALHVLRRQAAVFTIYTDCANAPFTLRNPIEVTQKAHEFTFKGATRFAC